MKNIIAVKGVCFPDFKETLVVIYSFFFSSHLSSLITDVSI